MKRALQALALQVSAIGCLSSVSACNVTLDLHGQGDAGFDAASCGDDSGTCRPGQGCDRDPCSHCVCDDQHAWTCTPLCVDAGGACPATPPSEHSACDATSTSKCSYKNSCGGYDEAVCMGSEWRMQLGRCFDGKCPAMPPPTAGAPCKDKMDHCHCRSACGTYDECTCDGSKWVLEKASTCTAECPKTAPSSGSPCSTKGLTCAWTNGCLTKDYATCSDGGWVVSTTCAPLECPIAAPTPGSACTADGVTCGWMGNCDAGGRMEATCTKGAWIFAEGCK